MVEAAEVNLVDQKVEILNHKNLQNGSALKKENAYSQETEENYRAPADGGSRAWVVMLGSFFCNGILFGIINSYGVLFSTIHENLQRQNVSNAYGKAALVGSFSMGTTFLVSPVSGVLTDYIGIRKTTFLGGLIASSGMFLSSFSVDNIVALCFTYGIMYGLGGALAYTPSLAVLGHYFKKYLGKVNGFVTAGSSAFTIIMPYVMSSFLTNFGEVWTLRFLALISAFIMECAFLFKPVKQNVPSKKISLKDVFNMKVIKNTKYIIWTSVIAMSLFGYFVPYVYMSDFVKNEFPKGSDTNLPILCIGITSGIGRLIFGYIADLPNVNRIYLQQLSFLSIGLLTMLLPWSSGRYGWLVVIVLGMGLFDGCFISLLGPIAFDICGREGATQAIGLLLGVCSVPLTVGPYVAGVILSINKSYTLPLVLAGIPPAVGSVAMFAIKFVQTPENDKANAEKASQQPLRSDRQPENHQVLSSTETMDHQGEDGL